ncbi:hypothetical protein Ga0466249_004517 [Sporomusaceae bacterium BoRhaA]|uniref:LamG-like jellyroll fold domain-containing protein n=1 Tax=Pelorhabdus rhamnosifermentans TaxID=2772457 RepID=UPI001C05F220|nr:LamG-like jellyroll fold domain-containing protein [Pelorhabdus rhamnosifermentans]MBU2703372.1 hypothetical protein [Pelorhabdus rhamnosifermentans]
MAVDNKYTVSLLHFDGGITDESGKVWTAVSNATTSTTQSKFGGSSLALNGTTQCIYTPATDDFNFGTGDFTIDAWINTNKATGTIVSKYDGAVVNEFTIRMDNYCVRWFGNENMSGTIALTPNVWHHVAIVRYGATLSLYVDGVLDKTVATKHVGKSGNTIIAVGEYSSINGIGGIYYTGGYIDEVRISKGIARWTSNFTPSTEPYSPEIPLNAPTNLTATAGDSQVTLSWTAVTGATGYNVKRATTAGGPYITIGANVSTNSYVDDTLVNGTTYYYVVTAITADDESGNSNEVSATPGKQVTPPSSDGNVLLQVTMIDSSDREFQLSATEIDGFVNWYNHHASTDTGSYALNKNIGIQGSKEYLAFDKIISFEVMPLTK